jgi:hypothetical protein
MPDLVFEDFHKGQWHCGGDYPKVHLTKVTHQAASIEAYVWMCNINIDFDGSSTAYGPEKLKPADHLGNAFSKDKGWFGVTSYSIAERDEINAPYIKQGKNPPILLDTDDKLGKSTTLSGRRLHNKAVEPQIRFPVVQQAANKDPHPGFYVSATSRPKGPEYLQSSFTDASKVAFGALSGRLRTLGGLELGDCGLSIRLDKDAQSGWAYEDSGGEKSNAVAECSHKVFLDLGGVGHNNNFQVGYIVFPRSKRKDGDAKASIGEKLRLLAQADNADQLVRLIAYCGLAGKGGSGLKLWEQEQAKNGPDAAKVKQPPAYLHVINGLRAWGYTGSPRM